MEVVATEGVYLVVVEMVTVELVVAFHCEDPSWLGLPGHVLRASQCCLHLLQKLDNFSPVDGVSLKLHMGIGAGTI